MTRAAVLGAGSWGTTFAKVLADAGLRRHPARPAAGAGQGDHRGRREPRLPARRPAARRGARDRRPGRGAARRRRSSSSPCPSQSLRDNLTGWSPLLPSDATLLSLMKGIELGTTKRMSEVICEVTGAGADRVAVALGPEPGPRDRRGAAGGDGHRLHATPTGPRRCRRPATRGTSGRTPTPTWSAASSAGRSRTSSRWPAASPRASGFGDNTRASLITRGLAETARLGWRSARS